MFNDIIAIGKYIYQFEALYSDEKEANKAKLVHNKLGYGTYISKGTEEITKRPEFKLYVTRRQLK